MARQWLVPGGGFIDERGTEEYLVPGSGFFNENQAEAVIQDESRYTSGGAVSGGSGTYLRILNAVVAGGAVEGGTTVHALTNVPVVRGGVVSGGACVGTWVSAGPQDVTAPVAGGMVSGGVIDTLKLSVPVMSGGVVTGGTGGVKRLPVGIVASGGMIEGGDADVIWIEGMPDDEEWQADNIRQIIKASKAGSSVRFMIQGSAVKAVTLVGASVGRRSGSTGNYSSAPTRLTFNGGDDGVVIPRSGSVWTDWVTFSVTKNTNYLIHLAFLLGTNWLVTGNKGTVSSYYKLSGLNDTLTETLVGYLTSTKNTAVVSMSIASAVTTARTAIGGAVEGGTVVPVRVRAEGVAGGLVGGGTSPWSTVLNNVQTYTAYVDGGLVAGGSSDHGKVSTVLGTGGLVAGGQPEYRAVPLSVGGGGVVAGGSAIVYKIAEFLPDGGAVTGNTEITASVLSLPSVSGGAVSGGQPTYSEVYGLQFAGSGGAVIGGTPDTPVYIFIPTANGGVVVGGTVDKNKLQAWTGSGGGVGGGSPMFSYTFASPVPVGGAVSGGAQVPSFIFQGLVSGGGVVGGAVTDNILIDVTGSGGVVVGGTFTLTTYGGFFLEGGIIEFEGMIPRIHFVGLKPTIEFEIKEYRMKVR